MKPVLLLPLLVIPAIAMAQTPPPAGTTGDTRAIEQNSSPGQMSKPKDQIRVEENSIVPDAGSAGPSAAPTMKLDCQAEPASCSQPVGPLRSSPLDAQAR